MLLDGELLLSRENGIILYNYMQNFSQNKNNKNKDTQTTHLDVTTKSFSQNTANRHTGFQAGQ